MSKAIVIGGVLGLIGGGAMLTEILLSMSPGDWGWYLNLIMTGIVLLGGILGIARKKNGGSMLLVMGILLVFFGILSVLTVNVQILPYSIFGRFGLGSPLENISLGIPLEAFIILLGAVIILGSPKD